VRWTIGEVAELFDISTDTLRYYEKSGLLAAHKNSTNGYRYYSYNELVLLMDILFFRNMEVPVADIRQVVTQMDIGEIKNMLYENERVVEARIRVLIELKKLIAQVAAQYKLCEERLGVLSIVSAPSFKYKLLGMQPDDLIGMIRKYKKTDWSWMNNIRYTLLIPGEELVQQPNFLSVETGISLDEEHLCLLDEEEQQELTSLPERDYLYTIVATNYLEQENTVLTKALHYLQENGRQVETALIGRYMASSHKDGLDYYEIWIGLK
jgi:DNA-binding transcriptional MerR regulator